MAPIRIRVMVVVGHPRVRDGLAKLLRREPWIDSVIEVEVPQQAIASARVDRPDVVIADVRLPIGSGFDLCRELLQIPSPPRVILLASVIDNHLRRRAAESGAAALLLKELDTELLLRAVRQAM